MEYFEALIILIVLASFFSIRARMKDRKEFIRKEKGELIAEDFKIIE